MLARILQNTIGYEPSYPQIQKKQQHDPQLLPSALVGKILQLEMECQQTSATKGLISELVSLYTAAVEYYEANGNQKYIIYKRRMHQFLSKHSIECLLQGKKPTMIARRQVIERNKQHAVFGAKDEVQRIIDKTQKKVQTHKKIIDQQLNNQQKNLESRIQRRKSMSNRSTKTDNQDFDEMGQQLRNLSNSLSFNFAINGLKEKNAKKVFL